MSFLCLLLILPTGDERVERLDAGEEAALGLILSSRGEERGVLVERLLDGFEDPALQVPELSACTTKNMSALVLAQGC